MEWRDGKQPPASRWNDRLSSFSHQRAIPVKIYLNQAKASQIAVYLTMDMVHSRHDVLSICYLNDLYDIMMAHPE